MENTKKRSVKNLGLNLYLIRQKSGKTIEDVAFALEVSTRIISYWESGQKVPTLDNATKLAEFYDVPFDSMLRG